MIEEAKSVRITSSKSIEKAKYFVNSYIIDFYNKNYSNQERFAKAISMDQPKVSHLLCGDIEFFSLQRLIYIVNILGFSVNLSISKRK